MDTKTNISNKVYEELRDQIRDEMDKICLQFFSCIQDMLVCIDASTRVKASQYVDNQFKMEREKNAARKKRPSKRRV